MGFCLSANIARGLGLVFALRLGLDSAWTRFDWARLPFFHLFPLCMFNGGGVTELGDLEWDWNPKVR